VSEENYCEAQEYYELALQVSPEGNLGVKATQNMGLCRPQTPTQKATTPSPDIFTPTSEVTVEPPTAEPTTPVPAEETPVPTVGEDTTPTP
jgi:hypothetical protein